MIYGCNFGQGDAGEDAVATLSELTGADVAASDDLTGAEAKGGDWDLELNVGTVETAALSATAFEGVLMDQDGDGVDDVDYADKDGDGILDTDEGEVPDFVNGDFSAGGTGYTTTGAIDYVNLTGGPNIGDSVARLDNNRTTGSLTQVLGGAETTISELEFEFGWNNGTLSGGTAGQNIEIKINGVTYLTIETPDDGGTNQDNAT